MLQHVAIIMDGNGRWAQRRLLPRVAGHSQGVESVRAVVTACIKKNIPVLTLFAFSSENWRRPAEEVSFLLGLFLKALRQEVAALHENGVRIQVFGDRTRFSVELQQAMQDAESLTNNNQKLHLNIALNYGGRWDIVQAVQALMADVATGRLKSEEITEVQLQSYLSLSDLPEPDLLIRTGGEQRISNFLLWQAAYTEFYFTDTLWPDFREPALDAALLEYSLRERRFGHTTEQMIKHHHVKDTCINS